MLSRRQVLQSAALSLGIAAHLRAGSSALGSTAERPAELAHLPSEAIRIKAVEPIRMAEKLFVRVTAASGEVGIAADNGRLLDLMSLLERRIAPFFVGKDARELPSLVDQVYLVDSNYKYAGMPFWCSVALVELAVLDLLGRRQGMPVGALLGPVLRSEIPVYLTRLARDTTAEQEVSIVADQLARCGAKACKLKIGGRMKNEATDIARTNALVPLARRTLGDKLAIYVDANGSYTADEAISVGRMLESFNVGFFEEPCPWENYDATLKVAQALNLPIAAGEQDSSWQRFRWMTSSKAVDLLQPDIYYNGGLIRTRRVGQLAEQARLPITPHSPKTGHAALPMLHFASVTANLGPHQEYAFSPEIVEGKVRLPARPGLGIAIDDHEVRKANRLADG